MGDTCGGETIPVLWRQNSRDKRQEIRREEGGMVRQRSRGGVEREKPRSVANMRERDRTLR